MAHSFHPDTVLLACCCTLHLCRLLTELAISDPRRFHGLISSMMPAKDGGMHCRSAQPDMETRPISQYRPLLETLADQPGMPHLRGTTAGERLRVSVSVGRCRLLPRYSIQESAA